MNDDEKQKLEEIMEKNFENTQIRPGSRILCVGNNKHTLLHYIHKSPYTFSKMFIYHKHDSMLYDLLKEQLGDQVEFHTSLAELPTITDMRKDAHDDERYLVVFDCMTEIERNPIAIDYFLYSRPNNITLFCMTKSRCSMIPPIIRSNMHYLLLSKITNQKDWNLILSEFDTEDKQLRDFYKNATKENLSFLKIDTGQCESNKRFSKCFKDFYKVYDYEQIQSRCLVFKEDLMKNRFHPRNIIKFKDWGIDGFDSDDSEE